MRVLLAQNMPYVGGYGGAIRSNRIMLEQLAARGHRCHVVAPLAGGVEELRATLDRHGAAPPAAQGPAVEYDLNGVRGHGVPSAAGLVRGVRRTVADQRPDVVLVPSDDPGGLALGAAFAAAGDRVVYLAHTLQQLPFGPRAFYPSQQRAGLVRRAAGVIAVSRAAHAVLAAAGVGAELIYPHVYGSAPFPRHDGACVTMVNPCGYKGIGIFLALADAFATVPFLAVAGWGTTPEDRRDLARRANVSVVEPVDRIDDVLRRTRVLLMPSLWDETFGYTAVESLLRGIPVLASAVGGLAEATLGLPGLLPVRPIERYDTRTDPARPVPVVPPQDLGPWSAALHRLLDDRAAWLERSDRGRRAAAAFVAGLDEAALGAYLHRLVAAGTTAGTAAGTTAGTTAGTAAGTAAAVREPREPREP